MSATKAGLSTLRDQPWWTAADDAELDVLVRELVSVAKQHANRCCVCSKGGPWCQGMAASLEVVVDWRDGRILRSKAGWLRERETIRGNLARLGLLEVPA
jgi:hypothetical protein